MTNQVAITKDVPRSVAHVEVVDQSFHNDSFSQMFSIPLKTLLSESESCFSLLRDIFLDDGEALGSSSASITLEAAGVTTLCLLCPLFDTVKV